MPLCMSRLLEPAHFLCALGDILNCNAFSGIGDVVIAIVRDLNDTYELVVDHDALGAVLASAFRFANINVINQLPE